MYLLLYTGLFSGFIAGLFSGIFIYSKVHKKIYDNIGKDLKLSLNDFMIKQNENLINASTYAFKNAIENEKNENEKNAMKISSLIDPLKNSLVSYQNYLDNIERERKAESGALKDNLDNLYKKINDLESDTKKLTGALKNPSIRGKWGEITLRRVVEIAGMTKYCDFSEQVVSDDKTAKPDMIINLPNGKKVIVDSKVPLNGYFEYLENEENKNIYLEKYISAFNSHVNELTSKKYWEKFDNSIDFVVMFLPMESLLSLIMDNSKELIENAISKKVIISTPITLISLLLTIHMGWKDVNTMDNFNELISKIKDFYNNLETFVNNFNETSKNLSKTIDSFNKTSRDMNKKLEPVINDLIKTELTKNSKLNIDNVDKKPDELNHLN